MKFENSKNFHSNMVDLIIYQMLKHDMSQAELARKSGISDAMISKYISEKSFPSAENLYKIAVVFDVSTDYLMGRTPYETIQIAGHHFAEELDLNSDALIGLMKNIKDFQDLFDIHTFPEFKRYIDEFFKSDVIFQLLLSGCLQCLLSDQEFVIHSTPRVDKTALQELDDIFKEGYKKFLIDNSQDISIKPEEIINNFCKEFNSFLPTETIKKISEATAITETAGFLRSSDSLLVKSFFSYNTKVISIHDQGKFPDLFAEVIKSIILNISNPNWLAEVMKIVASNTNNPTYTEGKTNEKN